MEASHDGQSSKRRCGDRDNEERTIERSGKLISVSTAERHSSVE